MMVTIFTNSFIGWENGNFNFYIMNCAAGFFKLPHRLIFAIVTLNSLYIYDTESVVPLAIMAGLHYAAITDVAW